MVGRGGGDAVRESCFRGCGRARYGGGFCGAGGGSEGDDGHADVSFGPKGFAGVERRVPEVELVKGDGVAGCYVIAAVAFDDVVESITVGYHAALNGCRGGDPVGWCGGGRCWGDCCGRGGCGGGLQANDADADVGVWPEGFALV